MDILTLVFGSTPQGSTSDTLTPAIIGIIGVVVGSIIGFAGNFAITLISNKQQMEKEKLTHKLQLEREEKAHIRHLQEEKINRLRQVYAKVLLAATMLQKALAEMQFVMDETVEKRNERISAYLADAFSDWEKVRVDLMLEEPDERVIEMFNEVYDAFIDYTQGLQINKQLPNTVSIQKFQSFKKKANDAVDKLKRELSSRMQPNVLNLYRYVERAD